MKIVGQKLVYSPSDLVNFMENEFITWMDRYYLEFPGEIEPDDDDGGKQIFQSMGAQHEGRLFEKLRNDRKDIVEISRNESPADRTLEAMSRGAEVIYQAALERDNF